MSRQEEGEHVVVVLGCNKPNQNPNFKFEESNLHKRIKCGVAVFLSLREKRCNVRLLVSGAFDEAVIMGMWAKQRLCELGMEPTQAASFICVEPKSLTTVQNAQCCRDVCVFDDVTPLSKHPNSLQIWVVTGLAHLIRGLMLFRAAFPAVAVVCQRMEGW